MVSLLDWCYSDGFLRVVWQRVVVPFLKEEIGDKVVANGGDTNSVGDIAQRIERRQEHHAELAAIAADRAAVAAQEAAAAARRASDAAAALSEFIEKADKHSPRGVGE